MATDCLDVAVAVADRLREPEQVTHAVAACARQSALPGQVPWLEYGLARGDAGLAVLFSMLATSQPEAGWDRRAHDCLRRAADALSAQQSPHPGLYSGVAGFAAATWIASRGGRRYRRVLNTLDRHLADQAHRLAAVVRNSDSGLPVAQFDLISGLTGVTAYLLWRSDDRQVAEALCAALMALGTLLSPSREPRWRTPQPLLAGSSMNEMFPTGNLNCGLAHGLPGPLAVLALSSQAGWRAPETDEAIFTAADWLLTHRTDDEWGMNWPLAVPLADGSRSGDVVSPASPGMQPPTHAGWCYGAPGVAWSLWLAGNALEDDALRTRAGEAFDALCHRPPSALRLTSATFCHGLAGLFAVLRAYASATGNPSSAMTADRILDELLAAYDARAPLGYRSAETGGVLVDQPGLLDGAPGVALVLSAEATGVWEPWSRLFLLS